MSGVLPHERCTATSKAKGVRCGRKAIPGGKVCTYHGGAAPQVKKAAALRLAELVDPAISVLTKAMRDYRKEPNVALRAALGSLDRNGYGPTQKIAGFDGGPLIPDASERETLESRIDSLVAETTAGQVASATDGEAS